MASFFYKSKKSVRLSFALGYMRRLCKFPLIVTPYVETINETFTIQYCYPAFVWWKKLYSEQIFLIEVIIKKIETYLSKSVQPISGPLISNGIFLY